MNLRRVDILLWLPIAAISMAGSVGVVQAEEELVIVANPGSFGTVEKAAVAEKQVDWWDADTSDDLACTECFAATELRDLLAASGVCPRDAIRLAGIERMPEASRVILIGTAESNPLIGALPDSQDKKQHPAGAEGYAIFTAPAQDRHVTVIRGGGRAGTLYGAYAYAEQLGVRFYGLGDQGTALPATPPPLPAELDLHDSPDYLTRGFWAWEDRGDPAFFLWMARNRLNLWTPASVGHIALLKKLGIQLAAAHHDVQYYCLDPAGEYPYKHPRFEGNGDKPADPYLLSPDYAGDTNTDGKLSYFEAHPEWYCLKAGKRSDRIQPEFGDNYCTSNEQATTELARNLVQHLIDGRWQYADLLNFWMLDNGKWCECEACKKQGTYTDRLMIVVDRMLKAIDAARAEGRLKREVSLATLAYHETLPPPSKPLPADFDYAHCAVTYFPIERCYAHPLGDPTCTEVNARLRREFEGWTTGQGRYYTGSIFIGEYYNVSGLKSLPLVFTRMMATDIPWYHGLGARHFHYMHTPTRLWGTWTLNQYLMGRLLWDVNADVNALLGDFFTRYYPTTGGQMRPFYGAQEYASSSYKVMKHYINTSSGGYSLRGKLLSEKDELFPLDHLHYEGYYPVLNDGPDLVDMIEATTRARRFIDDALLTCADPTELARLREDERRFAYGEATVLFYYHITRTVMFTRQGQEELVHLAFDEARRQAAILESIVDLVQVASSHANAKNGLEASGIQAVYEKLKDKYGK